MLEYFVYTLSFILRIGYSPTAIILLLLLIAIPAKRSFTKAWLNTSNLLLLLPLGVFLFQAFKALIATYITNSSDVLRDSRFTHDNPYGFIHWSCLIVYTALFPLLLFKRFRQSVPVTVLALLAINLETLYFILNNAYLDYTPSYFLSLNDWHRILFAFAVFNFLVMLIYFSKRYRAGRAVKVN